ncbi:hypothetical protein VPHD479_0397 [Vibrio phage D479]
MVVLVKWAVVYPCWLMLYYECTINKRRSL